ncbi:MAG: hypothetical protein P4M05_02170 [Bradyrhizobium sp.]|nr:hypothetical protein [Bradyrhizobium sp.]
MSHDNNHEITRISFREEVERSLESVLPANVPAKQKREAVTRVEQILERYNSPYPDPNFLAKIEELAPGSAEKIVAATLEDLQHRRAMDLRQADIREREINFVKDIANSEVGSVKQGRWLGFLAYVGCLIFSGTMYYAGSEKLAFAGFGAAAIGIVAQLIRGGSSGISITAGKSGDDDDEPEEPKEKRPAKR